MDIARYRDGYRELFALVDGLGDGALRFRPAPGRWSIHEVLVHLADAEAQGYVRTRSILADADPRIMNHDEHAWSVALDYHAVGLADARALIVACRTMTTALLARLDAEAWGRTGTHSVRGALTLRQLVTGYMDHVDQHLAQIRRNLAAYGAEKA